MRAITLALVAATVVTGPSVHTAFAQTVPATLTLQSARVSLDGTSNVHAYTASTTAVTLAALEMAGVPSGDVLDHVLQPGYLKSFEVAIPAKSLVSPKEGIDKNMHKALKANEHPTIRFRLRILEAAATGYRAAGVLAIAGVERDVVLQLQVERKDAALVVKGTTDLLMTDFGITPPKAMLGMLTTNPQVKIRLELVLGGAAS